MKESHYDTMSNHYHHKQVYRERPDWEEMTKEEDKYVEDNQWPPKFYFALVEEYETEMARRKRGGKGEKREGCVIC